MISFVKPLMRGAVGIAGVVMIACSMVCCQQGGSEEENTTAGDPELTEINQSIAENPGSAEPYARRAEYHRKAGNYSDAILDMEAAMMRDSVNEDYHHLLADIYMASAKSQYALGVMDRASMLFPDSISTLLKVAEVNLVVKQYDRAFSAIQRALNMEPQNTEALFLLGLAFREQGQIEQAIQTYQTIVELDSEHAEAWTMLGSLYEMQSDPRALQCYNNAIDINPQSVTALHSKAFYLQNTGNVAEAINLYRKIHEIDPDYTAAWLNRGILHLETDSLDQAAQAFDKLTELDPKSALGFYYAGLVADSLGQKEEAQKYYQQALSLNPSSARARQALEKLK